MLRIRDISVKFGDTTILNRINLELNAGEIYGIIGPSGSGKSTFLHVLCNIIQAFEGEILLNEETLHPRKHKIAFVPQHYGLPDWQRVDRNILLPQRIRKEDNSEHFQAHYRNILEGLDLTGLTKRFPRELSGGQRQRVSLARAFVQRPDILLMDEPFSALDAITSENSQELFLNLWKENRTTTIFTTHNVAEAVKLGKRIILFSPAPATVLKVIDNPVHTQEKTNDEWEMMRFTQEIKSHIKALWE
ncbi:MAG: ATP-binding cassette domain-containing protein [Prevotellaceae bacterium]|jgi:NitT/TauT family transport system ATP-binding protein|nr:ATP-binding cassette domain-containing protein [Prevotellaceae bacterium]